jgi:hypothetical protein
MEIDSMRASLIKKEKSQLSIIYDFYDFQHKKQKIDLKSKLNNKQTNFNKFSIKKEVSEKMKAYRLKIISLASNSEIKEEEEFQSWRIGIICKKDCFFILTEVLKSLQNIGCEWMILSSSYKIKGRKLLKNNNNNEGQISFLIQIFSVNLP